MISKTTFKPLNVQATEIAKALAKAHRMKKVVVLEEYIVDPS